ncbi:hypothetical protein LTR37_002327 [Vermiconidia calcicola]|uniref:Uncharacterized protein n=1 Tax=Vermiconidia calcicola TaxID=1690605 RepID=A0ACC3NUQ1_9PEZI|nr:hypothetical protein LTR37_002327 [Vermiconidia calcicola]
MTGRGRAGGRIEKALSAARNGTIVDNPDIDQQEAEKLKAIREGDMRAELKHIDKKFTEQGQTFYAETVEGAIPEQVNWWSKFALCLVRHMAGDHKRPYVQKISLQINSQHLKDILKKVIQNFPGVSFNTKDITVDKPYRVLFHYLPELKDVSGELEEGSEAAEHLDLLLDFIREEFKDTIKETENLLAEGMINYQHLWTIFRPGATIYAPVFGQPRAFTLQSYNYSCDPPGLVLATEYVDFDGTDMGTRSNTRVIAAFFGAERISDLSAFPIDWHGASDNVQKQLVARGRLWEQVAGMHFRNYKGIALEYGGRCGPDRYNVEGRVVVDAKTFHRLNANMAFTVNPFKSAEDKRSKQRRIQEYDDDDEDDMGATLDLVPDMRLEIDPLTDKQCMLASCMVRGFSFSEKRWLDFFVDKLAPAGWNTDCFEQLVLPAAQKDLVKALVSTHVKQRLSFDDIVKGKGKGLILVLHGPPGVGKTLTAETVAEYTKRPLYSVSSGDLGTNSSVLDERLSRILDMASTWKAVLLIDEADIFLERRSLHDLERNSLVSIFLRVLEYYEGILFLTSNRVNTFDDAFKSRIHVPLKYNGLTVSSRKQIWKNFLDKVDSKVDIDEQGYESLAQADINGRQIKNVVRTAKSLAQFNNRKLDRASLEQVIGIQMDFEHELDLTNGVNGVNGSLPNGH